MKQQHANMIIVSQLLILTVFMALTLCNEFFDIPHYLFGDTPTTFEQRLGEVGTEVFIFLTVISSEIAILCRLKRRIRILEGLLPICANCKKIRDKNNWTEMENYISRHSLANFSHSLCPDCLRMLYPEYYGKVPAAEPVKDVAEG